MRLIQGTPPFFPRSCAALPGRKADEYIDTGQTLPGVDPHIYISRPAAEEMARLIGWYSPEQVDDLKAAVAALEAEVQPLRDLADSILRAQEAEADLKEAIA